MVWSAKRFRFRFFQKVAIFISENRFFRSEINCWFTSGMGAWVVKSFALPYFPFDLLWILGVERRIKRQLSDVPVAEKLRRIYRGFFEQNRLTYVNRKSFISKFSYIFSLWKILFIPSAYFCKLLYNFFILHSLIFFINSCILYPITYNICINLNCLNFALNFFLSFIIKLTYWVM